VPRFRQTLWVCAMALLAGLSGVRAATADDQLPRGIDLDRSGPAREGPYRLRWFFSPDSPAEAELAVGEARAGVERIAILSHFDDRWILEAPADSASSVQASWSQLGRLAPDESGESALSDATGLVGADTGFFGAEDFEGDVTSTIAILDSGCDTAHGDLGDPDDDDVDGDPAAGDVADWSDAGALLAGDLAIRVVGWHDVTDDLPLAVGPWDDHFHGTALASAAFGSGRVDPSLHGVAPEGRFVVVKTWNFEGRWERWASDFFLGVEWLLDNAERLRVQGCVVGTVWSEDHGFGPAVSALADAGILLIAPVGNGATYAGWPAQVPATLGVGAATKAGRIAAYSNQAIARPYPPLLDVVAPGGSLLDPLGGITVADNEPNDSYRARVGTSIAAAMVGGAVSIVAEAARESGYPWPQGRARVTWLTDVLSFTAVELASAEPGAPSIPALNRGAPDPQEGFGMIQVPAAVQAVNNILWPGDRIDFALGDPGDGRAVWAARMPGAADAPLTLSLIPASGVDVDLHVYRDVGDHLQPVARSTESGQGRAESVQIDRPASDDLVIVAVRVSGAGDVIFDSLQRFESSSLWPRELRSRQSTAPVAADLDGDGVLELILTNTFAVDRRIHEFVVFDNRGRTFRFFPRSVESAPYLGRLTSPVVGRVGSQTMIVAGSDFGRVYAVSDSAQVLFSPTLTAGVAISPPVLWEEGDGARILFGTQAGVQVLTGTGQVERILPLGSSVTDQLAVGDLDLDGVDEIVAVSSAREIHALEIDGSSLPGWPVSFAGDPGAPVLIGLDEAPGVGLVVVAEQTALGELRLHAFGADGVPAPQSPWTLDRSGLPLLASSPLAAARVSTGVVEVALGAALGNLEGDQIYRVWRLRPGSGTVTSSDLLYSPQHLQGMLHFSRGLQMDEPRLLELSSSPGLEMVQSCLLDWKEAFVGNPRRYGSSRQFVTWEADGSWRRTALGPGHEEFPELWGLSPLVTDFEGDGYLDLVVVRDNRVYRTGSRLRWTLDDLWVAERGGRTRTACVGCEGRRFVATTPAPRTLAVSVQPNPFNPATTLSADLPGPGPVQWAIYDARGRRVRHWVDLATEAGPHRARFDGADQKGQALASGVYFVRLRHGGATAHARMVLVR
jgi:hypothetical protein